jgi:hypothetical protein
MAVYARQKMREGIALNAGDISALAQFAAQGDNLTNLGWDLAKPETWQGIQWTYANGEYYVKDIDISGLGLTGDLNLSGMTQLIRVFCNDNDLTFIDVSGSELLFGIQCRNAGIDTLDISNTSALTVLACEENYLSLMDIINEIRIIQLRENSHVRYANQKLRYEFDLATSGLVYDEMAQTLTMDTVQFSAIGVVPASVFIEVNTVDAEYGKVCMGSETIALNNGVGTYSLVSSPVVISAMDEDEYIEILVYTDYTRVQLVTCLYVRPVSFVF